MKKKIVLAVLTAFPFIIQTSSADVLAHWTFESSVPSGAPGAGNYLTNLTAETGSGVASGFHLVASIYSNPSGNGSAESLSSTNWAIGDFYQFALSTVGYSGLTVSFDQISSGTGPGQFLFTYSTDGTTFTPFGSAYTVFSTPSWSAGTPTPLTSYTNDLTAVTSLDDTGVVYFRLVNNSTVSANGGTVAATGTDRVDNFMVQATSIPEPSALALLGGFGMLALMFVRRRS